MDFPFSSFIGVSQSLPMTAYIKMIDIWMIFTMLYPFFVVTLYSLLEFMLNTSGSVTIPDNGRLIATFMLDIGLPLLATIFILLFWVLGITNYASAELNNIC